MAWFWPFVNDDGLAFILKYGTSQDYIIGLESQNTGFAALFILDDIQ